MDKITRDNSRQAVQTIGEINAALDGTATCTEQPTEFIGGFDTFRQTLEEGLRGDDGERLLARLGGRRPAYVIAWWRIRRAIRRAIRGGRDESSGG